VACPSYKYARLPAIMRANANNMKLKHAFVCK
jgi:hypothetical protein